ncbi:FHA domain-containing protein [Anaeromassilibacillus sp. 1001302B_160321_C8]|uniref:FHA domain-containing protein n=1 Tax=Anaeromassilibacillus sp. 1001302B_160321_C8 TaxID=2787132 RepID=UPI0018971A22|nr:FHA domain-containing protein [Anaeromassilibacillus sp. 1001302B_160321_C8]
MAKTVFFEEKNSKGAVLVLFNKQRVIGTSTLGALTTIGRATGQSNCDIKVCSPIVSRTHGEIALINGEYHYRDLNSTNGTYINNVLIGQNSTVNKQATILKDGDVICFDIRKDGQSRPDCVFALFATFCDANSEWSSLELNNDIAEICVGRSEQTSLQINNDTISEKHASFFCSSNGWAIIDHQSTNGVYLNGKKMSAPRYLEKFDVVRIVDSYFIFTGEQFLFSKGITNLENKEASKQHTSVRTSFSNVQNASHVSVQSQGQLVINITERSVIQRFKKMLLLQDINLSVSNGEMVLILGGSGAGKTTFINAVMGYEKATGKIMYKDTDIYAEYEQMKYEIGFVPQQDLLRGSDTVYDTLSNAAEMKLPRKMSYEAREERITSVLEELGLSRERETLVSKLSGGQRKRLSIAVEFIANPSLFFLDEPDSGVDDIMGRGLMENLRTIANQGKIVMVITHSPERASDLFDKVIVLAKSTKDNCGHLAFYGSINEAYKFFEVSSCREIVKKINRPDENGEGLSDYYIEKYAAFSKG